MAAAEARTAWQRVANRYIVQEDAKRAPKLARCPSQSSKVQQDYGNGEGDGDSDNSSADSTPLNWNSMNSNMHSDMKLWVQLQPNFGYQKDIIYGKLIKEEGDLQEQSRDTVDPYSRNSTTELEKHPKSLGNSARVVSTTYRKNDTETNIEELTSGKSDTQTLECKEDLTDWWFEGKELMDWKTVDRLISSVPDKDSFDTKHVGSGKKTEPWWHVTDRDELAFLVAQKSQERFENCDLPPPQRVHVRKDPLACIGRSDECKKLSSSFESNLHAHIYRQVSHSQNFPTLESVNGKHTSYDETNYSFSYSESLYRSTPSNDAKPKSSRDKSHHAGSDSNNAQLLEALCHSQTRAREAEIAAQKAYNEKEHILKLFFKQASHLFAYKQWLRLLQLETLCLQLKIKEQQLSTLLPTMPWMLEKDDDDKGAKKKGKKEKNCSLCRYIVAFAVGMSIASAGLLLGWTFGWLLPTI